MVDKKVLLGRIQFEIHVDPETGHLSSSIKPIELSKDQAQAMRVAILTAQADSNLRQTIGIINDTIDFKQVDGEGNDDLPLEPEDFDD